jgi:hypothetical protein
MGPNTRALVAATAARLVSGDGNVNAVFDYSESRYVQISGSVRRGHVALYDYDRGCHFSGSSGSLYDYGRSSHVSIQINGNSFNGYDYGDGHYYSGTVSGNAITIYDYGKSSYFNYTA